MTVGQIQRNYIQQNSVGIGFYGYSGWSGWSGWSGAGGAGLAAGNVLWQNSKLLFFDVNGFYTYGYIGAGGSTAWDFQPICDNTKSPNGVGYSSSALDAITGYTTKMKINAVLRGVVAQSGDFFAMRIVKYIMTSSNSVYGTPVAGTDCSGVWTETNADMQGDIIVEGAPVAVPGDGYYFVDVWDYHVYNRGLVPHAIFLDFVKVKD